MPTRLLITCLGILTMASGHAGEAPPAIDHEALIAEHQQLIQTIVQRREEVEQSEELSEERLAYEDATEAYRSTLAEHDELQNTIREEQRLRSTLDLQLRRRVDDTPFAREAADVRSRADRTNNHLQYLRSRRQLLTSHPGSPVVRTIADHPDLRAATERLDSIRAEIQQTLEADHSPERSAELNRLHAERNAAEAAIRSSEAVWEAQRALWQAENALQAATDAAPLMRQRQLIERQLRERRQHILAGHQQVRDQLSERHNLLSQQQQQEKRQRQLQTLQARLTTSLTDDPDVAKARKVAQQATARWQQHRRRHPLAERLKPYEEALPEPATPRPDPRLLAAGPDDLEALLQQVPASDPDHKPDHSDERRFLANTARQLLDMAAQGDVSGRAAHHAMLTADRALAEALTARSAAHPLGSAINAALDTLRAELEETQYRLAQLRIELDDHHGPMGAVYAEDERIATLQEHRDAMTIAMDQKPDPELAQARRDRDAARTHWQDLIAAHPLHGQYRAAREALDQMAEKSRLRRQELSQTAGLREAQAAVRDTRQGLVARDPAVAELDRRISRTEVLHKELDSQASQMEQRIEWHLTGLRLRTNPDGDPEVRRFEEQIQAQRQRIDAILASDEIVALRNTMEEAEKILQERTRTILENDPHTKEILQRAQAIERNLRQAAAMGQLPRQP